MSRVVQTLCNLIAAIVLASQLAAQPVGGRTAVRLGEGKFGLALDARSGPLAAAGKTAYQEPPLTVECWTKLFGKSGFNILVANSAKESPKHWELYTGAGSGTFMVYLPGVTPSNIDSRVNIVDGKWHHVAMTFLPGRIRLFVDGRLAADQPIGAPHQTPAVGPLWFGGYPPQGIGCDGLIDEVRISDSERPINALPEVAFASDGHTIGLWHFDVFAGGRSADSSATANAATVPTGSRPIAGSVGAVTTPTGGYTGSLPKVRKANTVDWANVGNDKGGMRYSTLKQIDRSNVKNLKVAWTYKCGDAASAGTTIECTPIVVDGVMYLTTVRLNVVALDAATGAELWKFDAHAGGVNRGVAYWSDGKPGGKRRILVSFPDGKLYSLDAKTGLLDLAFGTAGIVDLRAGIERDISQFGYGATSAPAVFENRVILGCLSSEGGPGAPGDIRAFDAESGKEVWRFHTIPRPGEKFGDTWPGESWKERPGANPWSGFTVDVRRGIVFCGTGSAASDFYGADRPGSNLFANCTLALDARTGKHLWHFQEVHHDLWDHDNACPPVMVEVKRHGRRIEAVAQPTKTGFLFLFDRVTGKPLYDIKEVPAQPSDIPGEVPYPTQPEPVAPPPFSAQRFTEEDVTNISPEAHDYVLGQLRTHRFGKPYIPPSLEGTVVTPGFHGGSPWSGASFDPTNGLVYVNSNNTPYILRLKANSAGAYDFMGYQYFNDKDGYPAIKPPWGLLSAIDIGKGTIAWQVVFGEVPELTAKGVPPTGTENFGGTIVTAGGLVFVGGTKDEKFHAYDKSNGKLLWDHKLNAGGYATPCTYMVNGRQYVAIAAGGGGKLNTKSGDEYVVFALPE
jgi:quinoprotein glucose dehydrogenase